MYLGSLIISHAKILRLVPVCDSLTMLTLPTTCKRKALNQVRQDLEVKKSSRRLDTLSPAAAAHLTYAIAPPDANAREVREARDGGQERSVMRAQLFLFRDTGGKIGGDGSRRGLHHSLPSSWSSTREA